MSRSAPDGTVLLLGGEPAAFSCALTLLEHGLAVRHLYPIPFGLLGASRDIGLCYPELGEPWERVAHALGTDLALQYHRWSRRGVEELHGRLPHLTTRGSRLAVSRNEQESGLLSRDALARGQAPVNDQVRLMSGAAVSNYAPVHGAHMGSFETHTLAFTPVKVLEALVSLLKPHPHYEGFGVEEWQAVRFDSNQGGMSARGPGDLRVEGDIAVFGTGLETANLLGRFHSLLPALPAQAFRSPPLREKSRSSVLGITASWGYERYRFDDQYRLLGCGLDPSGGGGGGEAEVDPRMMSGLLKRARQLFTDLSEEDEVMRWAVPFTGTCDGLPLLGPLVGEPRIQVMTGFGLSAWSRGWEAGRRVALTIAGENAPDPLLQRCGLGRFKPK